MSTDNKCIFFLSLSLSLSVSEMIKSSTQRAYVVSLFLPPGLSKHQMHRLMGSVSLLPWEGSKDNSFQVMSSLSLVVGK